MSDHTAADVARMFRCSKRKVTEEATRRGIGFNLGGRAGYRFTDLDVEKLRKAMSPAPAPTRRRSA